MRPVDDRERLEALYVQQVLPAFRDLLAAVRPHLRTTVGGRPAFLRVGSRVHGLGHFARVGTLGLRIAGAARRGPASPDLESAVTLAAFFHDSGRTHDGYEPGHAEAGAGILEALAPALRFSEAVVAAAAEAIRLHEAPESVVPGASVVAVALANADRLDRVRLGDAPIPERMYDDGVWRDLQPVSAWLLQHVTNRRCWADVEDLVPWVKDA